MSWYVYMIRCEDNSLYTGIAKDCEKRFKEHQNGIGAKYTKSHKPQKIEKIFHCFNRSEATKLEIDIKKISKKEKESLILSDLKNYSEYFFKKNE